MQCPRLLYDSLTKENTVNISDDERDAREDAWQEHLAQCPCCKGFGEVNVPGKLWEDVDVCPQCKGTGKAKQLQQ